MKAPTGKLKFAYETITNMECKIKELKTKNDNLTNLLEDVVTELELSAEMVHEHGQWGAAPSELVRLVLEQKDLEITALKAGMKVIKINPSNDRG